jgi:hypothetical protein
MANVMNTSLKEEIMVFSFVLVCFCFVLFLSFFCSTYLLAALLVLLEFSLAAASAASLFSLALSVKVIKEGSHSDFENRNDLQELYLFGEIFVF